MKLQPKKSHKSFEGLTRFWEHDSTVTKTKMKFSTYEPPGNAKGCVIFLSGLSCTEENFITKAGAQRFLAEHKLMAICPDTSPRGLNLPLEHESWDFGSAASFYVDATTPGYKDHYRMYSYVTQEFYQLLHEEFSVPKDRISIMGHSMGGHGALIMALREPTKFKSVSAFSPIVNPITSPWGVKAFSGYLGEAREGWNAYDSTELIKAGKRHPQMILIDQGTKDEFLEMQLHTENFVNVCKAAGQPLETRFRAGYDHSYYFISTFIESHIEFHSEALG